MCILHIVGAPFYVLLHVYNEVMNSANCLDASEVPLQLQMHLKIVRSITVSLQN